MSIAPSHIPSTKRHLPADFYGRFDIKITADGGKQYSLPHTLGATVLAITTTRKMLLSMGGAALLCAIVFPSRNPNSPLADTWIYIVLVFFPIHASAALAVSVAALVTGMRKVTRITIREDGLIWNDQKFFPAGDIWMIGYGFTDNKGKADETFAPKIEIQLGTQTITLADGLDVTAAKLFERLFSDDTRRYWHRHN